jgi:quinol monooxygenase YgiN
MTTIFITNDNHFQVAEEGAHTLVGVIVVNRFRVPPAEVEEFRAGVEVAHRTLAQRPGYLGGDVGRNLDDPELWVLTTRWQNVGSYRRALSAYDVKLSAVPLLSRAIDEPSAYERVEEGAEEALNEAVPRELGRLDR